jgi:SET domain-containing protein
MWDEGEMKVVQPRLWFVAMRDIESGEELSYDYGDSYWDWE